MCGGAQVSLDDTAALDDVDQCIIYYNHAVILYYLKQYKAAFTILDKVMQLIEPMGNNLYFMLETVFNAVVAIVVIDVSGMQLLRLRSAIRRHHPPQRAVLSQI